MLKHKTGPRQLLLCDSTMKVEGSTNGLPQPVVIEAKRLKRIPFHKRGFQKQLNHSQELNCLLYVEREMIKYKILSFKNVNN